MKAEKTVVQWISDSLTPANIVAIVMVGFGFYLSYTLFKNDMSKRVTDVEKVSDENSSKLQGRNKFMIRTARQIDYLCEHVEKCTDRFPPLEVPE